MRILYLCHRIPYPPNKGEKIRALQQLRALAARHEVDVFTLADDPTDLDYRTVLSAYCREITVAKIDPKLAYLRCLPYFLTRSPLTLPYFRSKPLAAQVRKALATRSYDRIFVYCSAMSPYLEGVKDIPILTDLVDVDSDKWMQYAAAKRFPLSYVYQREGRALRNYERKICEQSCHVFVTTEREAELVRQLSDAIRVTVVPTGVDVAYFNPAAWSVERSVPTVIFTGTMSYFPNQDAVLFFARQVLPLIRQSIPEVRFLIVGHRPSRDVLELEKLPGITVTGSVPDVRTYLAQAHLAVAPFSIAAGIQNKVLEALAFGLPVVGTRRAVQGLTREVAAVIETGETAEELASKVAALLLHPEMAREKGEEGRRRVTAAYSWESIQKKFLHFVEEPDSVLHTTESVL